jgi:endonuclease/exonuclease/phosphatase family metal-dependent hydrolase
MLDWIERTEYPSIAAGDFNLTDQTEHYARITDVMRDAHREAGWGFAPTFPNLSRSTYDVEFPFRLLPPMIRIDYIFHEPQFRTVESRVLPNTGASDHYPVYAVLEIDLP